MRWHETGWGQEVEGRIGPVAPLPGGQAHFGKDNERVAMMAVEDLNTKGLTSGGKKAHFKLPSDDDAADLRPGSAAAQKLVDAKVHGVVGRLISSATIAALKIYSDAGVPQITLSATNPKYTQQGFKMAFRPLANDNALGAAMVDEIIKLAGEAIGGHVARAERGASLDKMPKGKDFRDRFEAKYKDKIQVYAPHTDDAGMVLARAMKKANSIAPAK